MDNFNILKEITTKYTKSLDISDILRNNIFNIDDLTDSFTKDFNVDIPTGITPIKRNFENDNNFPSKKYIIEYIANNS